MNTFSRVCAVLDDLNLNLQGQEITPRTVLRYLVLLEYGVEWKYSHAQSDLAEGNVLSCSFSDFESKMIAEDIGFVLENEFAPQLSEADIRDQILRFVLSDDATVQQLSDYVESKLSLT